MPLRDSEAVILRSFPLGESDRLVSFLSRAEGKLRGVARGARRPKSRFGATLELLSYVRMWYFERETRELVRINQCEMLESFLEAQREYGRSLALGLMAEVTEAVLPEREPNDPAFRLLLAGARSVQRTGQTELAVAYFALWTVRLAGWLPQLEHCAQCGAALESQGGYGSPVHPALLCSRCKLPGMRKIPAEGLQAARQILQGKLEILEQGWRADGTGELREYALDLIEHQIERKLTTRRMMESHS